MSDQGPKVPTNGTVNEAVRSSLQTVRIRYVFPLVLTMKPHCAASSTVPSLVPSLVQRLGGSPWVSANHSLGVIVPDLVCPSSHLCPPKSAMQPCNNVGCPPLSDASLPCNVGCLPPPVSDLMVTPLPLICSLSWPRLATFAATPPPVNQSPQRADGSRGSVICQP